MKGYTILLVDDEELAITGLMKGLHWNEIGFSTVLSANSMDEAQKILQRQDCHVMLSDIEMPGGSGLDLIRYVKQTYPDIVCLFYTAYPSFEYCQEALKIGAMDYLVKPIPYQELEEILVRAIERSDTNKSEKDLKKIWGELTRKEDDEESPVSKVKQMIQENLTTEISRDELADAVYMNPDYLTRLFKKETGMSISDYIIETRLTLAKKLLRETDLSIVEITEKTGFSYSSYFARLFKKKEGITPQQYRGQAQK